MTPEPARKLALVSRQKGALSPELNEAARRLVERLLADRGWTQRQLAEKMGVDESRLSQLKAGRGGTSLEPIVKLCDVANVRLGPFLETQQEIEAVPSVSTLDGFEEARAALRSSFTDDLINAAVRALDALPAARVDNDSLLHAVKFAIEHRRAPAPLRPVIALEGEAKVKGGEVEQVKIEKPRGKVRKG